MQADICGFDEHPESVDQWNLTKKKLHDLVFHAHPDNLPEQLS
jgi:hypothetical protein